MGVYHRQAAATASAVNETMIEVHRARGKETHILMDAQWSMHLVDLDARLASAHSLEECSAVQHSGNEEKRDGQDREYTGQECNTPPCDNDDDNCQSQ